MGDFEDIMNGASFEIVTPELDPRADGIYFHAVVDGVVTYENVVAGRVVMLLQVNSNVSVEVGDEVLARAIRVPSAGFIPAHLKAARVHMITACKPDGSDCIPTTGYTLTNPATGTVENFPVRRFVQTKGYELLVRLYGLGL